MRESITGLERWETCVHGQSILDKVDRKKSDKRKNPRHICTATEIVETASEDSKVIESFLNIEFVQINPQNGSCINCKYYHASDPTTGERVL